MRMYSPTSGIAPRIALKDHYLGSIPIKKGVSIAVKIKPCQFNEKYYPNPHEFNPDRWSINDPTKTDQFSYFPFSSGKRNCIGMYLALL
jgi:cytochrome P450